MRRFAPFAVFMIVSLGNLSFRNLGFSNVAFGQDAPGQSESSRKVVSRVAPDYPELARRLHIHGVVRVEASVRPNGTVKTARVVGGNPVLAEAAVTAVTKWKFESGSGDTSELVQLSFEPQ
jgi:TonB family protein